MVGGLGAVTEARSASLVARARRVRLPSLTLTRRTREERDALAAEVRRIRDGDPSLSWTKIGKRLGISPSWASELYAPRDRPSQQMIPCPECGTPMSFNADLCRRCARERRSADHAAPVLEAIARGHHTIPEIAVATGRSPVTLTRYLATLVKRGVITRVQSSGYHRRWLYHLP